jgi:hypothetical protein
LCRRGWQQDSPETTRSHRGGRRKQLNRAETSSSVSGCQRPRSARGSSADAGDTFGDAVASDIDLIDARDQAELADVHEQFVRALAEENPDAIAEERALAEERTRNEEADRLQPVVFAALGLEPTW